MPIKVGVKIDTKEMRVTISKNQRCWVCNKDFRVDNIKPTTHHMIPKRLNPFRNLIVNVCEDCHRRIHFNIIDDDLEVDNG